MLLVTDARRKRLASSSSEELEDETSLSSHAIYAFLAFPFFSLLKSPFSLTSLFGHSDLICPCSQQP